MGPEGNKHQVMPVLHTKFYVLQVINVTKTILKIMKKNQDNGFKKFSSL